MKTQSATTLIQETRIRRLNDRGPTKGEYVLYWMQQTLRAELNHALEYAVQRANDLNQPLLAQGGHGRLHRSGGRTRPEGAGTLIVVRSSGRRPRRPGGTATSSERRRRG